MHPLNRIGLVSAMLAVASMASSSAVTYNFVGADDALWTDPASWNPQWLPAPPQPFADDAIVNTGNTVVYNGGDDFQISTGSLTLDGAGSGWSQSTTGWTKIGTGSGNTGTLGIVNGADFTIASNATQRLYIGYNDFSGSGALGQATLGVGSSMTINGLVLTGATTTFDSSGTLTMGGDFRVRDTAVFSLNDGSVTAPVISFDLGDGGSSPVNDSRINIAAGQLTITGNFSFDGLSGIFRAGTSAYINLTLNSAGSILFTSFGTDADAAMLANITNGAIRYNDTVYTAGNYTDAFIITHPSPTSTLITAVPEPSLIALLAAGGAGMLIFRRRKI